MTDSFTGELWDSIGDIYGAILAHPFIEGLTDGTLPAESFAFYVVQDGLYLKQYASALAAVASRAPQAPAMRMFARHAADAVAVEQELHSRFCCRRSAFPPRKRPPPSPPRRTSPIPAICSPPFAEGPMPKASARSCPVTGFTGKSARNCCD